MVYERARFPPSEYIISISPSWPSSFSPIYHPCPASLPRHWEESREEPAEIGPSIVTPMVYESDREYETAKRDAFSTPSLLIVLTQLVILLPVSISISLS